MDDSYRFLRDGNGYVSCGPRYHKPRKLFKRTRAKVPSLRAVEPLGTIFSRWSHGALCSLRTLFSVTTIKAPRAVCSLWTRWPGWSGCTRFSRHTSTAIEAPRTLWPHRAFHTRWPCHFADVFLLNEGTDCKQ